jgi:hypothetical protein
MGISDDAIRERAYLIWEREGRPHGRDFEHWVRAQVELLAEGKSNNSGANIAPAPARVSSSKPAPPAKSKRGPAPRAVRAKKPG